MTEDGSRIEPLVVRKTEAEAVAFVVSQAIGLERIRPLLITSSSTTATRTRSLHPWSSFRTPLPRFCGFFIRMSRTLFVPVANGPAAADRWRAAGLRAYIRSVF
jgi:hypothetical protein